MCINHSPTGFHYCALPEKVLVHYGLSALEGWGLTGAVAAASTGSWTSGFYFMR